RQERLTFMADGPFHVLIVEDHRDSAFILKLLLEIHGYCVRVAYSGPEGLQMAHDAPPDVLLCDIGLPGMPGFDLARDLREQAATANIYLVALTGYGSEEDRYRSLRAGFDVHLLKPVEWDDLHSILKHAASRKLLPV